MSESENHQPNAHGSHGISPALVKQRPAVMEPLKVICNTSNGPTDTEIGLANGLANDTHKYQTPPVSPKQKEPRAKMSLSPNKTSAKLAANQNIDLTKVGIKRGYARKTMTPDRIVSNIKVKSAIKPSPSNDSISTSPASSREGSVESIRSVDNSSLDGSCVSQGTRENNNNKSEQDINTDDTRWEASSVRSTSPGKFPPRARKSLPKAGSSLVKLDHKSKSGSNHFTFKITDFASKLGLHGQSLANVDAKTLDQLILKAKKEGLRDSSRANSPAPSIKDKPNVTAISSNSVARVDSPVPKSDIDDETGESGRSTPSRSKMDSPGRKKKKRKSGTYNLPSNKRIVKKKRSNPSESSSVDLDRQSISEKQSDVVVIEDEVDEQEGLAGEMESIEEWADTDDKDTGLSDETGSEKSKETFLLKITHSAFKKKQKTMLLYIRTRFGQ